MKRVLVPCGSGVATSNMAAEKLKKMLKERQVEADVQAVDFKSLKSLAGTADLIVSIAAYDNVDYGVTVLNGVPLLTGVGADELADQAAEQLR